MRLLKAEDEITWRSLLAIIYSTVIMQPAAIWLTLANGPSAGLMGMAAMYSVTLLFTEIANISGKPLTRQETFLIWAMSGIATWEIVGLRFIWALWNRFSPLVLGSGLLIPDWYAPPEPELLVRRTFLDSAWVLPFLIYASFLLIERIYSLSVGLILHKIFVEVEKLPFPLQQVEAEAVITLSERTPAKMRVLTTTALVSLVWTVILYGSYTVGLPQILPVPWFDFNKFVEMAFPGASFGISTDPMIFAIGFMLPLNISGSVMVGSLAIYFFGNWLVSSQSPVEALRGIFSEWTYGMTISDAWQRSTLTVWAGPLVGLGLAGGLLPLLWQSKTLVNSFKSLKRLSDTAKAKGILSSRLLLILFVVPAAANLLLLHYLVPDFPVWIFALLYVGWTFAGNLISSRAVAVTGQTIGIPYVWQGLYVLSGYGGSEPWCLPYGGASGPFGIPDSRPTSILLQFKTASLCGTKITTWIKAYFITFIIASISSFAYVWTLWSTAPIPSSSFPWTVIGWPVESMWFSLWSTRSIHVLEPMRIATWFGIGIVIYTANLLLKSPLSFIAFVAGCASTIPGSFTTFLGTVTGLLISKRLGKEWWMSNRTALVAGIAVGEGVALALLLGISIATRMIWMMPY